MALVVKNFTPAKLKIFSARCFSTTVAKAKTFQQWYRDFWTPKAQNTPPYAHFTQIGDPVLRNTAAPVPAELVDSPEIEKVIEHMVQVMRKYECVGIAAPQIGVSLRIIAIEFKDKVREKYPKAVYEARKMSTLPLTVFVNPVLKVTNYEKHKHPEGCMSVRGYAAEVERYDAVTLTGVGKLGTPNEVKLSGWNARIAQHEMDHLNGKLYTDHMDRSTFTCTCWEAVNSKGGRVEIPFYK